MFSSVSDERCAYSRQPHLSIRFQNRTDNQTLQVVESNVFVTVATEDNRSRLLIYDPLCFDGRSKTVNRRLINLHTEDVDGISVFIHSLNDSHRAAVNGGTEEPCDCCVSLIFNGGCEWSELRLVVTNEARIQILETNQLPPTTGTDSHRALAQSIHSINEIG